MESGEWRVESVECREPACLFQFEPMNIILYYDIVKIVVSAPIPERSRPFPTNYQPCYE